jgi:hypothetical protein
MFIFNRSIAGPVVALMFSATVVALETLFWIGVS